MLVYALALRVNEAFLDPIKESEDENRKGQNPSGDKTIFFPDENDRSSKKNCSQSRAVHLGVHLQCWQLA